MSFLRWFDRLNSLLSGGLTSGQRGAPPPDVERALEAAHAQPGDWRGTDVPRVVDGDTLKLQELDVTVRLARIDAPETGQPGAKQASHALARKLDEAERLNVQVQSGGRYGRAVAEVWADGENLSDWMLREGYAERY